MRMPRIRDDRDGYGCYYHLMNRVPGTAADRPLNAVDKEKFVELLLRLGNFYTVEIISYCVMSNHFHLVLWAPHEQPDESEVVKRWNRTYPKREPPEAGSAEMARLQARMRDFSEFMKDLQMRFTCWYNRTRPVRRTGPLWGRRFKSVVLDGNGERSAVWACAKYVELNPVRAKLVADPAEYRWSSWGRFCGSGKHPFRGNFMRHMKRVVSREFGRLKSAEIVEEFRAQMVEHVEAERRQPAADANPIGRAQRKSPPLWVRADRRVRFWSDGAVIGSRSFVREVYARLYGDERAERHRLARGSDGTGSLYSMRQLATE